MAKYICTKSFAGKVMGRKGREFECEDKEIVEDLLKAGYIEPIEKPAPKRRRRKTTPKKEE